MDYRAEGCYNELGAEETVKVVYGNRVLTSQGGNG